MFFGTRRTITIIDTLTLDPVWHEIHEQVVEARGKKGRSK